jgi:hypothetical protein
MERILNTENVYIAFGVFEICGTHRVNSFTVFNLMGWELLKMLQVGQREIFIERRVK